MIDIIFEDIKLETIPTNFEDLTIFIEKVLYHKLPSMYNIVLRDEQDAITLTNEEEFQAALQLCHTKKQKCLLEVTNVEIDASVYLLKKQMSTEQSMIFQQSQMEVKQKLAELQFNKLSEQSNYSFLEESVYSKKDSDLQIPEIMGYYSNALVKFMDNYSAQTTEYRQQNEAAYRNTFERLLNRMNEKLVNQFEMTTNQPNKLQVQRIISEEDSSIQQQQKQQQQQQQSQQQQQPQVKKQNAKKPSKKGSKKAEKEERWKNLAEISGKSIDTVKSLCQKSPELNDNEIIDKLLHDNAPEDSSVGDQESISDEQFDNSQGEDPINLVQDESDVDEHEKSISSDSEDEDEEPNVIDAQQYKGQSKGQKIQKDKRTTPPFLTKYERARVIGTRALQISKNSPIYVDPKDTTDPISVAQQELNENKIPFIVRRYLPNGDFEDWELQELERLD